MRYVKLFKMDQEALHKEIDLIQACINRMANNSFLLKGWAFSIIAVVLALAKDSISPVLLICAVIIPVVCFWYLDAVFLRTEKKHRKMYEWVLKKRKEGDLEYQYDLNPKRFDTQVNPILKAIFSKTLLVFYGIPIFLTTITIACQWFKLFLVQD